MMTMPAAPAYVAVLLWVALTLGSIPGMEAVCEYPVVNGVQVVVCYDGAVPTFGMWPNDYLGRLWNLCQGTGCTGFMGYNTPYSITRMCTQSTHHAVGGSYSNGWVSRDILMQAIFRTQGGNGGSWWPTGCTPCDRSYCFMGASWWVPTTISACYTTMVWPFTMKLNCIAVNNGDYGWYCPSTGSSCPHGDQTKEWTAMAFNSAWESVGVFAGLGRHHRRSLLRDDKASAGKDDANATAGGGGPEPKHAKLQLDEASFQRIKDQRKSSTTKDWEVFYNKSREGRPSGDVLALAQSEAKRMYEAANAAALNKGKGQP